MSKIVLRSSASGETAFLAHSHGQRTLPRYFPYVDPDSKKQQRQQTCFGEVDKCIVVKYGIWKSKILLIYGVGFGCQVHCDALEFPHQNPIQNPIQATEMQ